MISHPRAQKRCRPLETGLRAARDFLLPIERRHHRVRDASVATIGSEVDREHLDAIERWISGLVGDQRLQFIDENVFEPRRSMAGCFR